MTSWREIVLELGGGPLPQWRLFNGRDVSTHEANYLILYSEEYQVWKIRSLQEEIFLFNIMLEQAEFLDETVTDFFKVPVPLRQPRRTLREWATDRLESARQELALLYH